MSRLRPGFVAGFYDTLEDFVADDIRAGEFAAGDTCRAWEDAPGFAEVGGGARVTGIVWFETA